jgi:hypothetical protein
MSLRVRMLLLYCGVEQHEKISILAAKAVEIDDGA